MAPKAKPAKKNGAGKSKQEQINGLAPELVREFFDELHSVHDDFEEVAATARGRVNRIYDKACDKLDISKDALKFVFQEERTQRKKAAKAAKMDTRARDSMERLSAAMPEGSPMAIWANNMAKLAGATGAAEAQPEG